MAGAFVKKYLDLYHRLRALCTIDPSDPDPCWLWKGTLRGRTKNYPRINVRMGGRHRQLSSHRLSLVVEEVEGDWELVEALYDLYLLAGFEADHRCNNPKCINGDHLRWETRDDHLKLTLSRRSKGLSLQKS